jgi:hypothetical protein
VIDSSVSFSFAIMFTKPANASLHPNTPLTFALGAGANRNLSEAWGHLNGFGVLSRRLVREKADACTGSGAVGTTSPDSSNVRAACDASNAATPPNLPDLVLCRQASLFLCVSLFTRFSHSFPLVMRIFVYTPARPNNCPHCTPSSGLQPVLPASQSSEQVQPALYP